MGRACSTLGRDKKCTQDFGWIVKGTDNLEKLGVDGKIMLE
jgi:hypothetical protein